MSLIKEHLKRLTGFSVVGVIVTLFSLLLLYITNNVLHFNLYIAYLVSYFLSILLSYFLNAYLVWKVGFILGIVVKYFAVYLSSMILGLLVLWLLKLLFTDIDHTLLSFLTIPITMLWNYLFVNKLLSKPIQLS